VIKHGRRIRAVAVLEGTICHPANIDHHIDACGVTSVADHYTRQGECVTLSVRLLFSVHMDVRGFSACFPSEHVFGAVVKHKVLISSGCVDVQT